MGRGRPPKPAALKDLEGNRGRRELPPDLPLSGLPECPETLGSVAAEHFTRVAGELGAIGVVKSLDSDALAMLSQEWSTYWEACEQLEHSDNPEARKEARMLKYSALKAWNMLAARFGLTPADRIKLIGAGSGPKAADPIEERFLKIRA
jgi:P27 family predicted phage terminase small subunit